MFAKACPKCRGDIMRESLSGGAVEFTCLQCGRMLRSDELAALRQRPGPMQFSVVEASAAA